MHPRLLQQRHCAVQVLALTDCESLQSSHLAALRWLSALQSLDLSRCARLDSFMLRHVAALPALTSLSLQVRHLKSLTRRLLLCCRSVPAHMTHSNEPVIQHARNSFTPTVADSHTGAANLAIVAYMHVFDDRLLRVGLRRR